MASPKEAGQGIVEFLVCAVTFLFIILGVLQLALVLNAQTTVNLAAYNAARSAIVTGGNQATMLNAVRMSLLPIFPRHGRATSARTYLEGFYGEAEVDQFTGWNGLHGAPITEVSILPDHPGVTTFDDPTQIDRTAITVKVVHRYELVIPIVNAILARVMDLAHSGRPTESVNASLKGAARSKLRSRPETLESGYRIPLTGYYTMHLQSDLNL